MKNTALTELLNEYPNIFPKIGQDMIPKLGSYMIPSGWVPLVKELCSKLEQDHPDVHCEQMKDKFGGLRFYVNVSWDESRKDLYDLISNYEERSYSYCERCGTDKEIGSKMGGWLVTCCKSCFEKEWGNSPDIKWEPKSFNEMHNIFKFPPKGIQ